MVRLPTPGSDTNAWGDILNEFLRIEHNSDGSLKANAIIAAKGTMRGSWTPLTDYAVNDIVQIQNGSFQCIVAHTSSSASGGQVPGFQTDLAAGKWKILSPRRQWYDIRDYGAKINNGNDTTAIQAAIDACAAAGGGTVFIPEGMVAVTQLVLKSHVCLRGTGRWSTTIRSLSNSNTAVIKNLVSPDAVQANAQFYSIMDLKIDGNRANNTGATSHGISLLTNPLFTEATNDEWFDSHYLIQNVMIINCAGAGLFANGRSEARIKNVFVEKCNNGGISPAFDTYMDGCSTSDCDKFGFSFTHGSIMAVECKAFISGRSYGTNVPGFLISGSGLGCTLSSCHAQNNFGAGFVLRNTSGVVMASCVADSNNFGTGNAADAFAGIELDNAANCIVDLVSQQGYQVGQLLGNQASALRLVNGSDKNDLRITTYAAPGYTLGPTVTADSTLAANRIVANGVLLNPSPKLTDNSDVSITNPGDGQTLLYSGAQNKWINSSAGGGSFAGGMLGDASDGAVTLNGSAAVPWASLAGSTYTMTRDAHTTSLTINAGITLVSTGYRIFCQGTVTNNGTMLADGVNATSSTGPTGGTPRSLGVGAKGGNGATGNGVAGAAGGFGVGNGGSGGNGSPGTGGTATSAITGLNWVLRDGHGLAVGAIAYAGSVSPISGGSGGSGGGGDNTNAGGGAGSGGNVIGILARSFNNAGAMTARGGNGFTPLGGNCGGGGGGGGGGIFVFTINPAVNTGSTAVTGGTGGSGSGTGTAGASGTAGTTLFVQLQ